MILPLGRYVVAWPLRWPPLNEITETLRSLESVMIQSPSILPFANVACDINGALKSLYGNSLSIAESFRAFQRVHMPLRSPKLYWPWATTSPLGEIIFQVPWLT